AGALGRAAGGEVRTVPCRATHGRIDGQAAAAGNAAMMREFGWLIAPDLAARGRAREASGHSVVYVGWGGRVHAVLALDDTPLPEARATVEALRRRGMRVLLLTGDLAVAAQRSAAAVGIAHGDVAAALAPEDKRATLDRHRNARCAVAMVGDGLNDAPVLAGADVGIAVGSATDLARESAAIVLPPGGLWMLPWAIDVARAVRAAILTNLMWAFGYNFIAVGLAMAGLLQPVLAAGVMAGSSIVVVLNSLRLERLPDPVPAHGEADGAPAPRASCAPAPVETANRHARLEVVNG